jgi:hypothetical protein
MNHVPDELLAALALGDDDVEAAVRDHVEDCPVCSLEVAELAQVHQLVRSEWVAGAAAGPTRLEPSPQVWQRILAGTSGRGEPGAPTAPASDAASSADRPVADVVSLPVRPSGATRGPAGRRRPGWIIAAAAACVLAGALLGRALWAGNDTSAQVVAQTALTTLDASRQREGTALLLDSRDGQELKIDATSMPSGAGYVEVWLLNADGKRMVSLGILATPQAVFPVPPGAIGQGYTIVDLSREQFDDRPQHSGDSLMRGTLPA